MQKFLRRANTKLTIGWAAAMLSGMSLVSMMLSLFRERLLNTNFGVNSLDLDAYRVAFKVPRFYVCDFSVRSFKRYIYSNT